MLIAGELVDAERALAIGLVDEVSEPMRSMQRPRLARSAAGAALATDADDARAGPYRPDRGLAAADLQLDRFLDAWRDPTPRQDCARWSRAWAGR